MLFRSILTGQQAIGEFGLGLAAAVLLDAFILRTILVPALMHLSGQQVIGEIGLGMAAAVLLDAFILRTLLVPALMHLSGRANWWLPSWPRPVAGIHTNQPGPGISGPGRVPYQNPHMSSSLLNEIVRERIDPVTGERMRFSPAILLAWCRKSPQVSGALPLLYLHGLPASDFAPASGQFPGTGHGLSAATITRLAGQREHDGAKFGQRSLKDAGYVYLRAGGIHLKVCLGQDKVCLLVMTGVCADGQQALSQGSAWSPWPWVM